MTLNSPPNRLVLFIKPLSVLLLTFAFLANFVWFLQTLPSKNVKGISTNLTESAILSLVNLARTTQNLEPLTPDPRLHQAALNKAKHMLDTGNFDHYYQTNDQAISPWQFITDSGFVYLHAGENLARHYFDSEVLVKAWLDSPAHRDNILNPNYSHTGLAIVQGPFLDQTDSVLIVQFFATPFPAGITQPIPQEENPAPLLQPQSFIKQFLSRSYPPLLIFFTAAMILLAFILFVLDFFLHRRRSSPDPSFWRG